MNKTEILQHIAALEAEIALLKELVIKDETPIVVKDFIEDAPIIQVNITSSIGSDFDKDATIKKKVNSYIEDVILAEKLLHKVGIPISNNIEYLIVGLKCFINDNNKIPFMSKRCINVAAYDENNTLIKQKYIKIDDLGELEMPLRKANAMKFEGFTPKPIFLPLR